MPFQGAKYILCSLLPKALPLGLSKLPLCGETFSSNDLGAAYSIMGFKFLFISTSQKYEDIYTLSIY
jgi:hypothetical protein